MKNPEICRDKFLLEFIMFISTTFQNYIFLNLCFYLFSLNYSKHFWYVLKVVEMWRLLGEVSNIFYTNVNNFPKSIRNVVTVEITNKIIYKSTFVNVLVKMSVIWRNLFVLFVWKSLDCYITEFVLFQRNKVNKH